MDDRLLDAVREFTESILLPFDRDYLLDRLVEHATSALRATGSGIMLEGAAGRLEFAAASDSVIREVERVQDRAETGACYEAYTTNQVVPVPDLRDTDRWPPYTAWALDVGLRSVIGVPLRAWGRTIGVLNVYRDRVDEWTPADIDACQILAAMGAGYILNATQMQAQQDLTENLQAALESRATIERAKGILMERERIDADAAFKTLRQAAAENNRKLQDIAQEIVGSIEYR